MNQLHILPQPPELARARVRRSCILRRIGGESEGDLVLWYELPAGIPQLDSDDAEPFLLACLLDAMREDREVVVHGSVGWQLLSNLHEFAMAWSRWRPELRPVRVEAHRIPAATRSGLPRDAAVAAYSGGVDATCTLFQHTRGLEGNRTRKIVACGLIHGFDIQLDQKAKFDRSLEVARLTLDPLGIPVHALETNFRQVMRSHWDDCHGAALVSSLQFLKGLAPACLIGSSKPYEDLVLPYGSNPVTDHLMSSESFEVLHDGARFDRTQKVAIVAGWPEACRNLRVCWRGSQIEPNCGKCEKCIRTKLSFLALGKEPPTSLGAVPTAGEILGLVFMSHAIRVDFQQILRNCGENQVRAPWVRALRLRIRFHKWFVRFFHVRWLVLHAFGKV